MANTKKLYSIRDNKVCEYGMPVTFRNDSEAIRAFGDIVMDKANPNNLYAKHPSDFSIVALGEFNLDSGEFLNFDSPHVLAVGSDYLAKDL